MMSTVRRLALLAAALFLAAGPSVDATCAVAMYYTYRGVQPLNPGHWNISVPYGQNPSAPSAAPFALDRWGITASTPSNGTGALLEPVPATIASCGYTYNTAPDSCATTCTSQVTLYFDMETPLNTFYMYIGNGVTNYYYSTGGTWVATTTAVPSSGSGIAKNAAMVSATSLWPTSYGAPAGTTFGTGVGRVPSNDTLYGSSSTTGFSGYFPQIFQVPFPYWDCSASANYINIFDNLVGNVCNNVTNQFAITRNCPSAKGDPQFAGLRGQDYQVHGIDGGIYNIISDKYMQLNSKFVFLTGPRPCPIMPSTGRKSVACFAHAGSYLGTLALRTNVDERLMIESGSASKGLKSVTLNGERLSVGDNATLIFASGATGYVQYVSTHEVHVQAGLFTLEVENSDSFLNLRSVMVKTSDWKELRDERAHGLLGQTWNLRKDRSAIEGKVDDYLLESEDAFGTDFLYNRFEVAKQ